jgi:drug/metabolite transporter (DMT)-like permease
VIHPGGVGDPNEVAVSTEVWAGILAVGSAFVYVAATAVQQVGVLKVRSKGKRWIALLTTPVWLLGIVLAVSGFLGHVAALALGSLALVSILQTSQIVFMLPFSAWTAHAKLKRREIIGAGLITFGLIGIILFGNVTKGVNTPPSSDWALTLMAIYAVVVIALVIARIWPSTTAIAYGTSSGILYGAMAGLIKSVLAVIGSEGAGAAFSDWETYAFVLVALSAMGTQQVALGAGHLSTAMASIIVSTPVASTVIAITIFDERFLASGLALLSLFISVIISFIGVFVLPRDSLTLGASGGGSAGSASGQEDPDPQGASPQAAAPADSAQGDTGFAHGLPGPNPLTLPVIPNSPTPVGAVSGVEPTPSTGSS